jgi:ribose transport system substrate-binding protein
VRAAAIVAGVCAALLGYTVSARPLRSVGISLGSLGNPYFVALSQGAEARARQINPQVRVTTLSADYDLNKQFSQIDSFIAAGVDLILVNAADPRAIRPAIKRARAAGIAVVAVDVAADGVDATVQTDNVQAGAQSCQFIADRLHGSGSVIIENGPPVASIVDRVNGCKAVLAQYPGIHILSADQDGKASRDGGFTVAQGYLTRFPQIDAIFTINDPQAIGTDLALRQFHRDSVFITSVDGAPDIETALKSGTHVLASSSQDPWAIARLAIETGYDLLNGKAPTNAMVLLPSTLVTRDNVKTYRGWMQPR